MVRLPKPSKVCQMVNLVTVASHRTLKLTLAVVGLAGLLGAFVITGTSPSTDSISADETVKQKSTYTIKRERRYQVERYDADSEDRSVKARWDVYAVSDFELNDDIIVDDYYFSSVLDLFMADWMSFEFQSGRSRTDRLFIDGVERVLIDVPGCPLILTTDHRYRRPGDHNWWSFVVQVDRQDTYDQDMSRCHLVIQEYAAFTIGWIPVLIIELRLFDGLDASRFGDSVVGIDRDANPYTYTDCDTYTHGDTDIDGRSSTYGNHLARASDGYQRRFPLVGRLCACIGTHVRLSTV